MTMYETQQEPTPPRSDELRTKDEWTGYINTLKDKIRSPEFLALDKKVIQQQLDEDHTHCKSQLVAFIKRLEQPEPSKNDVLLLLDIHDMLEGLYAVIDTNDAAP